MNKQEKEFLESIRNKINKKGKSTDKYVDVDKIIKHLESKFDENMSWDNYGTYWEIDHIIPQSFFDFTIEEEIKKCWTLKNLRPFPKSNNASKSNALIEELIEEYKLHDVLPKKNVVKAQE